MDNTYVRKINTTQSKEPLSNAVSFSDMSLQGEKLQRKACLVHDFENGNSVMQMFSVYRGGSNTKKNLTPREGDTSGPKKGLSTFSNINELSKFDKVQEIETDRLNPKLIAVRNGTKEGDSHVSILPYDDKNDEKLIEWSKTRDDDAVEHDFTKTVRKAIVNTIWFKGVKRYAK